MQATAPSFSLFSYSLFSFFTPQGKTSETFIYLSTIYKVMEQAEESMAKALKHLHLADHMITQTYPLLREPKLLLTALENLFLALTGGMAAILHYERYNQRIPPFQETFDSKFNMLKLKVAPMHRIDAATLQYIQDICSMVKAHRKSPLEFSRKDSMVICSDDYHTETLSLDAMKRHLGQAKKFIHHIQSIVGKHHARIV